MVDTMDPRDAWWLCQENSEIASVPNRHHHGVGNSIHHYAVSTSSTEVYPNMKPKRVIPVDSYSRLDKPEHHEDATSSRLNRRGQPMRGWLSFFLLLNTFGIAGFIFASAWYFPSTSSTGVVEQVIKQGDVSFVEVAHQTQAPASTTTDRPTTRPAATDAEQTSIDEGTVRPTLPLNLPQSVDVHQPKQPYLRTKDAPGKMPIPSVSSTTPTTVVTAASAVVLASSSTPHASVSSAPRGRAQSMSDLLKRMKQEQLQKVRTNTPMQTSADQPQRVSEPASQASLLHESESVEKDLESMHIQVWLRADVGVEVDNQAECEALGAGCEVKAWRSMTSAIKQEQTIFRPVQSNSPILLQPAAQNGHAIIKMTCPMSFTSTGLLHDQMTLFFVLSPSQIEYGDMYKAQKFFGNSPYGQFLLHGGKPAFYSSGGLRESGIILKNNAFALLVYRLHRHVVDIKANGEPWTSVGEHDESFLIRVSGNGAVSLGNVKSVCDTNAFHGSFGEILVFNRVLSDEQVTRVEHYLLNKWWGDKAPNKETESPTPVHPVQSTSEPTSSSTSTPMRQAESKSPTSEVPNAEETNEEEAQQHLREGREQEQKEPLPRTFDPEGVFEWMPSDDLVALVARERSTDPSALLAKWKTFVNEQIASVRNFQFGGDVLRTFIRARRDELLTFRQELFGSG